MKNWSKLFICCAMCMVIGACSLLGVKKGPAPENLSPQGKVTIRWRNETEHENYGFNIYRGESEDGPFVKINKDIIPGGGTTSTPKEYVYVDQPLEIGKVYYYYIESISFANEKEKITPVTKVVVKTVAGTKAGAGKK